MKTKPIVIKRYRFLSWAPDSLLVEVIAYFDKHHYPDGVAKEEQFLKY